MHGNILILMLVALLAACSDDPAEPEQPAQEAETATQTAEPSEEAGETGADDASGADEADQSTDDDSAGEADAAEDDGETASGDDQARAPDAIYDRFCVACHEQGVAGAPKLGAAGPWEERLAERGLDGLVQSSIDGRNAMPAQGTCMDCTKDEMQATVEWMLDESGVDY